MVVANPERRAIEWEGINMSKRGLIAGAVFLALGIAGYLLRTNRITQKTF